jgi:outer membrane protein OmpA-like peptidoglycan-associated protein
MLKQPQKESIASNITDTSKFSVSVIGPQKTRREVINSLNEDNIQFVRYGDTQTLIVPTDQYFYFDSPKINDLCYKGLNKITELLTFYPRSAIYVAGFTDDIGSRDHKRTLSQARAEAIMTFLWAHGIAAQRMHPEGYADKHDVGDNKFIRGSAYNRRVEIQWLKSPSAAPKKVAFVGKTKFSSKTK